MWYCLLTERIIVNTALSCQLKLNKERTRQIFLERGLFINGCSLFPQMVCAWSKTSGGYLSNQAGLVGCPGNNLELWRLMPLGPRSQWSWYNNWNNVLNAVSIKHDPCYWMWTSCTCWVLWKRQPIAEYMTLVIAWQLPRQKYQVMLLLLEMVQQASQSELLIRWILAIAIILASNCF